MSDKRDVLTLCLRLCLEPADSHAPETLAVLEKWRNAWEAVAAGMEIDQAIGKYAPSESAPKEPKPCCGEYATCANPNCMPLKQAQEKLAHGQIGERFMRHHYGASGYVPPQLDSAMNLARRHGSKMTNAEIIAQAATVHPAATPPAQTPRVDAEDTIDDLKSKLAEALAIRKLLQEQADRADRLMVEAENRAETAEAALAAALAAGKGGE